MLITHKSMHIHLMTFIVSQHKVPSAVLPDLFIPPRSQKFSKLGSIFPLYGNIQVFMMPCLLPEQSINAPPAINPEFYSRIIQ